MGLFLQKGDTGSDHVTPLDRGGAIQCDPRLGGRWPAHCGAVAAWRRSRACPEGEDVGRGLQVRDGERDHVRQRRQSVAETGASTVSHTLLIVVCPRDGADQEPIQQRGPRQDKARNGLLAHPLAEAGASWQGMQELILREEALDKVPVGARHPIREPQSRDQASNGLYLHAVVQATTLRATGDAFSM